MLSSTSLHVGPTLHEGKGGLLASAPAARSGVQGLCALSPLPADAVRWSDGQGRGLARVRACPGQLLQETDGVSACVGLRSA